MRHSTNILSVAFSGGIIPPPWKVLWGVAVGLLVVICGMITGLIALKYIEDKKYTRLPKAIFLPFGGSGGSVFGAKFLEKIPDESIPFFVILYVVFAAPPVVWEYRRYILPRSRKDSDTLPNPKDFER